MSNPKKQDQKRRQEFTREVNILIRSPEIDLWYGDESGFEGDPKPRYILAKKGSRPIITNNFTHFRSNVMGAARHRDGKFISILVPFGNTHTFQLFLNELQRHIDKSKRNILMLDNASWHKTKRLNFGKIEPLYLPPYSPDLNPIEQLWLSIKNSFFSWFRPETHDELDLHLCKAVRFYYENPEIVKSICSGKQYYSKLPLSKVKKLTY